MRQIITTACLLIATFFAVGSYAESSAPATVPDQNGALAIETSLISNLTQAKPGQTITLAWNFKMQPGWHIYWKNAGDSGLPPELTASQGQLTDLTFPTPEVIAIPPITNYGYHTEVTLTSKYTLPTSLALGQQSIGFTGNFLYCKDICMPGTVELPLNITITNQASPALNPSFIEPKNTPQPLSQPVSIAAVNSSTLSITLPDELPASHSYRFIPNQDGQIDDSAEQTSHHNQLILHLDPQSQKPLTELSGILVNTENHTSHLIQSPISSSPLAHLPTETSSPSTSLLTALVFAFVAGLILNVMPCVLPVLSFKVLHLVQHHKASSQRHIHTLAYTAGVIFTYWVMGLTIMLLNQQGQNVGWGFHLQNPIFVATLCIILVTVALQFFGVFEIGYTLQRLAGKPIAQQTTNKPFSSFITGALAVVVATPCTVPFMGAAMAYALTSGPLTSILVFTAMGFGMASPFFVLTHSPTLLGMLPKPGPWMHTFRQALGWPIILTAIWLLFVLSGLTSPQTTFGFMFILTTFACSLWVYGKKPSLFTAMLSLTLLLTSIVFTAFSPNLQTSPAPSAETTSTWQTWSAEAVTAAQAHQPVFVHFTADWCITCKITEATVLHTTELKKFFTENNVALFRADWTRQDPAITTELSKHGRKGVPLYLAYTPGNPQPKVLSQLPTQADITAALKP